MVFIDLAKTPISGVPGFDGSVVAGGDEIPSWGECDMGDQLNVRWDFLDLASSPEIPDPEHVVVSSGGQLVAIPAEIAGQNAFDVASQRQDAFADAQVPDHAMPA